MASESMGFHDSEVMDDGLIDRNDAWTVLVISSCRNVKRPWPPSCTVRHGKDRAADRGYASRAAGSPGPSVPLPWWVSPGEARFVERRKSQRSVRMSRNMGNI